jgi:hypothetical protein
MKPDVPPIAPGQDRRVESLPVIFDDPLDPRFLTAEAHAGSGSLSVFENVRERFLDDPDELDLGSRRETNRLVVCHLKRDRDAVLDAEFVKVLGEHRDQAQAMRNHGP